MLIRFSGRWHLFFPYSATSHVHESLYLTVYLGFISRHNKYWKKSSLYYQIIQDDEWRTTLPSMAYHNLAAVFLIKCVLVVHLMKMLHSNLVILSCTQTHTHTRSLGRWTSHTAIIWLFTSQITLALLIPELGGPHSTRHSCVARGSNCFCEWHTERDEWISFHEMGLLGVRRRAGTC